MLYKKNFQNFSGNFQHLPSSHNQERVERKIRTFKEVCNGTLEQANKSVYQPVFELITICRETEYIMNTRPLVKFVGNQDDPKPLQPIDLLTGYLKPLDSGGRNGPTATCICYKKVEIAKR